MFGDHHVVEVRRILLELPGVEDVYASSSFKFIEVQYDEAKTGPEKIEARLEEEGYLGELAVPVEIGALQGQQNGDQPFFRTTAAFEQVGRSVSFTQKVPYSGRPLWPCPGMGPLTPSTETSE
jgi:hypothetical protein